MKLAIDSSQSSGSIAISDQGRLLYSAFFDIRITHSETLMPTLDSAMKLCGFTPEDIEEISVCLGPGSFTGLRIGLATAKGIAFARGIDVLGYNSLELAAVPCLITGKRILTLIDAKMKELYAAAFDEKLNCIVSPRVISPTDILDWDINSSILTGSAVPQVRKLLEDKGIMAEYAPDFMLAPKAELLFSLPAYLKPRVYSGLSLADLEPLYIRKSTAQIRAKRSVVQPGSKA